MKVDGLNEPSGRLGGSGRVADWGLRVVRGGYPERKLICGTLWLEPEPVV